VLRIGRYNLGMSRSGKRRRRLIVGFRVTVAQYKALRDLAAAYGLSMSELIRRGILAWAKLEEEHGDQN